MFLMDRATFINFTMMRICGGKKKECFRQLFRRQLADVPTPKPEDFVAHLTKNARGYGIIMTGVSAYTFILFEANKLLLAPLETATTTVRDDLREIRTEMKSDRTEIKSDMREIRTEMTRDRTETNKELREIREGIISLTASLDNRKSVARKRRNVAFDGTETPDSDDDQE